MSRYKNGRLWVLGGNTGAMELTKSLLGTAAGEAWIQPRRELDDHKYTSQELGLVNDAALKADGLKGIVCVGCGTKYIGLIPVTVIDHNGDQAFESASILQVLNILERFNLRISGPLRRWIELVAANDCGAYGSLEAIGANDDEVQRVRTFDRHAQGITNADEEETSRACREAEEHGNCWVIRMKHNKLTLIVDWLYKQNLGRNALVVSSNPSQIAFLGDGAVCAVLNKKQGSRAGGAGLGIAGDQRAFWIHRTDDGSMPDGVLAAIRGLQG